MNKKHLCLEDKEFAKHQQMSKFQNFMTPTKKLYGNTNLVILLMENEITTLSNANF